MWSSYVPFLFGFFFFFRQTILFLFKQLVLALLDQARRPVLSHSLLLELLVPLVPAPRQIPPPTERLRLLPPPQPLLLLQLPHHLVALWLLVSWVFEWPENAGKDKKVSIFFFV